jgi:hypothetical protein
MTGQTQLRRNQPLKKSNQTAAAALACDKL